jgi:hypothetical protein
MSPGRLPVASALAWALSVAAATAGCKPGRSIALRDTEGWPYRVNCTATACESEVESPHRPQPRPACGVAERAAFVVAGRRIVTVCHACVGAGASPRVDLARCRPFACERDVDCPSRHGGGAVRCVNGLCLASSQPDLDRVAAVGLCMMGAGPSGGEPVAGEARMAFARAACDPSGRCIPPHGCHAP